MDLRDFFRRHPKAALGFSGGVDSAYLLAAGLQLGAQVQPYFVKTPFQPAFELEMPSASASSWATELKLVELDVLALSQVRQNGPDRCYHCKSALFTALRDQALADGYSLLIDGTNASDDAGARPGMRALKELSVRSPLRECGITKEEVRRRSKDLGLFTWDKPWMPAWPPGSPLGNPSPRGSWKRWNTPRTPCSPWASPTSGCGCSTGPPGSSSPPPSWPAPPRSGRPSARPCPPGSIPSCWTWTPARPPARPPLRRLPAAPPLRGGPALPQGQGRSGRAPHTAPPYTHNERSWTRWTSKRYAPC